MKNLNRLRSFLHFNRINRISKMNFILLILFFIYIPTLVTGFDPGFVSPLENITVAAGRSAHFTCVVNNLGGHKVAWLRSDSKAILAIHTHMVTNNPRMNVEHNGHNSWTLMIDSVQRNDSGVYMCQINTEPMTSQIGILNVVEAPDILYNETSNDTVVAEGASVTLRCEARGYPEPTVTWRREDGTPIVLRSQTGTRRVESVEGSELKLERLTRADMGAYLCIASNRIPSPVSKRIMLHVHFFPLVKVHENVMVTRIGTSVSLRCNVEASPKSVNYWVQRARDKDDLDKAINPARRFKPTEEIESLYTYTMTLTIMDVKDSDFGNYSCHARNSLGTVMGTVELLKMKEPDTINLINRKNENQGSYNQDNKNELQDIKMKSYDGGKLEDGFSKKEDNIFPVDSPGAGIYYVSFGKTTEAFNFGSGLEKMVDEEEDEIEQTSKGGGKQKLHQEEKFSKEKQKRKGTFSCGSNQEFSKSFIFLLFLLFQM